MQDILERLERKMDAGFEQVDKRFEQVDKRFEQVDMRFERIEQRLGGVDQRLNSVDAQLQKQGVLLEAVSGDVKMALEGISGNREVMDARFAEVMKKLDERVQPIELATRHHSRTLRVAEGSRSRRKKQS